MSTRRFLSLIGLSLCLLMLLTSVEGGSNVLQARQARAQQNPQSIYLPIVTNKYPLRTVFGIEMARVAPERGLADATSLGLTWVRRNGLIWRDIEPVEGGAFNWQAPSMRGLEEEMMHASANNLNLVLVVVANPSWATGGQADCAPIMPQYYARFARFMAAAVERYSKPPFNVKYWEIGNEPDTYRFGTDSQYGCWGPPPPNENNKDEFYGGREYGNMLKVVYPAMKAANPTVQVLNGGLLLDHPYTPAEGISGPARFIEGVFATGAGASFDILAFHTYAQYEGPASTPDGIRLYDRASAATDWKVDYLRNLMTKYGVPQKPLINTEAALLCRTSSASNCREPQADAIPRLYARALRDRLIGYIWYIYDHDGFYNTALVEPNVVSKRPAYFAYKHAASMLGGAEYLRQVSGLPTGVEAHQFQKGPEMITIVWSNTVQLTRIPVSPAQTVRCSERDGGPLACTINSGSVELYASNSPKYIVAR